MTEFLHDEFITALSGVWFTFLKTSLHLNDMKLPECKRVNILFTLHFASSQKLVTWILIQCKSFSIIDLIFSIYMTLQHAWTLFHSREEEKEIKPLVKPRKEIVKIWSTAAQGRVRVKIKFAPGDYTKQLFAVIQKSSASTFLFLSSTPSRHFKHCCFFVFCLLLLEADVLLSIAQTREVDESKSKLIPLTWKIRSEI